jgi:hypothetical protein
MFLLYFKLFSLKCETINEMIYEIIRAHILRATNATKVPGNAPDRISVRRSYKNQLDKKKLDPNTSNSIPVMTVRSTPEQPYKPPARCK